MSNPVRIGHISVKMIASSIVAIVGLLLLGSGLVIIYNHMYEKLSPTSWRYTYKKVEPLKPSFKSGDRLRFVSTITRQIGQDVRREDTLFCLDDGIMAKQATQYRPDKGYEYRQKDDLFKVIWTYWIPVSPEYQQCKMCGTIIAITPLGYRKQQSYCTVDFKVNQ